MPAEKLLHSEAKARCQWGSLIDSRWSLTDLGLEQAVQVCGRKGCDEVPGGRAGGQTAAEAKERIPSLAPRRARSDAAQGSTAIQSGACLNVGQRGRHGLAGALQRGGGAASKVK